MCIYIYIYIHIHIWYDMNNRSDGWLPFCAQCASCDFWLPFFQTELRKLAVVSPLNIITLNIITHNLRQSHNIITYLSIPRTSHHWILSRWTFEKSRVSRFFRLSSDNYSTLLYSTLLYSTLLYSTLLYSTLLYSTLLYSTLLYVTLLYATLRYATLRYATLRLLYTVPQSRAHPVAPKAAKGGAAAKQTRWYVYIYIYIYIFIAYTYMCIHIYIYIYTHDIITIMIMHLSLSLFIYIYIYIINNTA